MKSLLFPERGMKGLLASVLLLALLLGLAAPTAGAEETPGVTLYEPGTFAVWPGTPDGPDDAAGEMREKLEAFAQEFVSVLLRYASGVAFEENYPLSQMVVRGGDLQMRLNDLRMTYGFLRTLRIDLLSSETLRCGELEPGRWQIDLECEIESLGFQGPVRESYQMRLVIVEDGEELRAESFWPAASEAERAEVAAVEEDGRLRFLDPDGDGLILIPVSGPCFNGFLLAVLDPMRVVLGFSPEDVYNRGYTVSEFGEKFGAVAAVNGGGFDDPDGMGNGSIPERLVVQNGVMYCGGRGIGAGFAGLDSKGVLQVGFTHPDQIAERDIREGCGYGPILIENGALAPGLDAHNLNPRTAIAQTEDGTILLLVIEGRRGTSLGATFQDLAELLTAFGAVTADNLDGGFSSLLWMDGRYVSNRSFVTEIRPCPTSFIVLPQAG